MDNLSEERIYSALRSLYRYKEMTEENYPEIMVESESNLLKARFELLTSEEIFEVIKIWPGYLAEQATFDVIDNQQFEQYLRNVN